MLVFHFDFVSTDILFACISAFHVYAVPTKIRKGCQTAGTGVTDGVRYHVSTGN